MSSLLLLAERRAEFERELAAELAETEARKIRFPEIAGRFDAIVASFPRSPLAGLAPRGPGGTSTSPAEALAFLRRHAGDASDVRYAEQVERIRRDPSAFTIGSAFLREMHAAIVAPDATDRGQWKSANNHFPVQAADGTWVSSLLTVHFRFIAERMERLEEEMHAALASDLNRPLVIAAYWLDLLCTHPFRDGNGRLCRLAVLLLLLQDGWDIWHRASLEAIMGRRRGAYVATLRTQLDGWWTGTHDLGRWCRFALRLTLDASRDFEARTERLAARFDEAERIAAAARSLPAGFSADEAARTSGVDREMTVLVLNAMRSSGRLAAGTNEDGVTWRSGER